MSGPRGRGVESLRPLLLNRFSFFSGNPTSDKMTNTKNFNAALLHFFQRKRASKHRFSIHVFFSLNQTRISAHGLLYGATVYVEYDNILIFVFALLLSLFYFRS
jgi:hypothetical protein